MCWIRKTRPGKRYEQHVPPVVIYIICCVICALAPLRISLQIPSVGLRTIQPVVSVGQRARQPQARPRAHQPAAVRGVFGYPGLQTSVLSQTHDCSAEAQQSGSRGQFVSWGLSEMEFGATEGGCDFLKTAVQIGLLSFLNPSQPPKNFKPAVQPSQLHQVTRLLFISYLILSILIPTAQN